MLAAFVLGVILGGGVIAVMLAMPAEQPLFSFGVENTLLVALGRYSRYAVLVLVSGLVCFTIVSIVNIVVDLLSLRDQTRGNYSAPILS